MTSPAFEVQAKVYATLKANAALMALVSDVYDTIPASPWGAKLAYASFGPMDGLPDDSDCIDSETHSMQIDVWSRATGGKAVCKKMVDAVKNALHEADLELTDNALIEINLERYAVLDDPDGLTKHGVLQFRVAVEVR
jgi:hypothetical protein